MRDIGGLMKTMQQMQMKVAETQKKMESLSSEGTSGAGLVKIELRGENKLEKITIDKSLLIPDDVEILEDLIKAAFEDARKKMDENRKSMEKDLMGGLNLPPGFKMPF